MSRIPGAIHNGRDGWLDDFLGTKAKKADLAKTTGLIVNLRGAGSPQENDRKG